MTLREIADLVQGVLVGDPSLVISGGAILRDAQVGEISLAESAKLVPQVEASQASAVLVNGSYSPHNLPHIVVENVHAAFALVIQKLRPSRVNMKCGIDPTAQIHPTAIVAETAYVGPNVKIGPRVILGENVFLASGVVLHGGVQIMESCQLGENCQLFPNVVLYENTLLGARVILHAGCVLGAYGFGYESVEGKHRRGAQLGYVEIEDDVEIGATTTIDRGTYGPTKIGAGTKIDNQVMIGHNCRIGRHNLICSHVGIAGSATTGDYVVLAGQVGLRDHIHVGDKALILAQSGVMNDVPPGETHVGSPALVYRDQLLIVAATHKLPEMRKQLKEMQRTLDRLAAAQRDRENVVLGAD